MCMCVCVCVYLPQSSPLAAPKKILVANSCAGCGMPHSCCCCHINNSADVNECGQGSGGVGGGAVEAVSACWSRSQHACCGQRQLDKIFEAFLPLNLLHLSVQRASSWCSTDSSSSSRGCNSPKSITIDFCQNR